MKRVLLSFLLAFGFANAGLFFGVDAGYVLDDVQIKTHPQQNTTITEKGYGHGYAFGINIGVQHYIDPNGWFGFRFIGNLGMSRDSLSKVNNSLIGTYKSNAYFDTYRGGLGLDLLADFVKNKDYAFGIFGGAGFDYYVSLMETKGISAMNLDLSSFQLDLRAGLFYRIKDTHQFELIVKFPMYSPSDTPEGVPGPGFQNNLDVVNALDMSHSTTRVMMGYKFLL